MLFMFAVSSGVLIPLYPELFYFTTVKEKHLQYGRNSSETLF